MKHKKLLRWMGIPLFFLLIFGMVLPAAALTPAYSVSGPYLSSTYYKNLTNLPRTGDKAFDTVAIALSQLDYREGNSVSALHGQSGGSGNFTEYNYALGQIGGTYGYAWCAAFVTWCLRQADAAGSAGGAFASCTLWVERLQALGQYSTRASGYTPKTGDLIFFKSAGVSRASDHVGLVRYVSGDRVYTVEGNSSDRVSLRNYKLSDTYIVGYGRPRYNSAYTLPQTALQSEDRVNGWYTVTNDFVNIRDTASNSGVKQGTLDKGEMVRITNIQNGWGCFYYNGKKAYISLEYADFTAPITYRVTYDGAGGTHVPAGETYWSMEQTAVSQTTPVKEGFLFLWWADANGTTFAAGDLLPAGDVALTAVWQSVPTGDISPEATPPTTGEGTGEDFLNPVPGGNESEDHISPVDPPIDESTPKNNAAIAAGAVVGVLTAGFTALWVRKKWKERIED